jgi:hypothetical protein
MFGNLVLHFDEAAERFRLTLVGSIDAKELVAVEQSEAKIGKGHGRSRVRVPRAELRGHQGQPSCLWPT